ncbi:MAG: hypothetical protein AB1609_01495 [Bacillota bacterium]
MGGPGAFAGTGRLGGGAREAAGGRSGAAGTPAAGAVMLGAALALFLIVGGSAVLGTLQRFGLLAALPGWVHIAAAYLCVAAGGWTAGRLSGRSGMLTGGAVGVLLVALAFWLSGRAPDAPADVVVTIQWSAAAWRSVLAVLTSAVAGGLAVSGT